MGDARVGQLGQQPVQRDRLRRGMGQRRGQRALDPDGAEVDRRVRPAPAQICRVKLATEVLPLVPVTATITSGWRPNQQRRGKGQRLARILGAGSAPRRDAGQRVASASAAPCAVGQDRGGPHPQRVADEVGAVHAAAGQRREQVAGPDLRGCRPKGR